MTRRPDSDTRVTPAAVPAATEAGRTRQPLGALAVCNGVLAVCLAASLTALWQWGQPRGWARIDRFSGGALLVYAAMMAEHLRFVRQVMAAGVSLREVYGTSYDPMMGVFNGLLLLGQVSVFLDYGHWHLDPRLERPVLQYAGLGIYLASLGLVVWTDRHLARGLAAGGAGLRLVTTGPYRHIRHPRYAALFLTNIALPLTCASPLGWLLVAPWALVVTRRIRLEEQHLREAFGAAYQSYAVRTGRLLPRRCW